MSRADTLERAAIALLVASVAGSALAFGALHPPVLVVAALAAAGSALAFGPRKVPKAAWCLLALAGFTAVQIVPLPARLVALLAPSSSAVWQGVLEPLRESAPGWVTLSVDPAATALEALKWSGYACVFLAACVWRSRRGAEPLALLVFGSALAVAVVTLAHGAVEAKHIYGYWVPNGMHRFARGPFVNPNNLAGYLNLGFFSGVGLWMCHRHEAWTRILPAGLLVLATGVVLTASRAGVGVFVLGILALGFVAVRRDREDWRRIFLAFAAVVTLAVGVGVAVGGEQLAGDLLDRTAGAKFIAWRWALDLVWDFPVFGVGRGAFETAFQPYRGSLGRDWTMVFSHPENFVIQWIADWGVLVGIVAVVGLGLLVRGAFARAAREPLAAGLLVALGALLCQNLVDNGTEIFGVVAAAIVALVGARPALRLDSGWSPRRAAMFAGAVLATCGVVIFTGAEPVKLEREHIARAYKRFVQTRSREGSALRSEIRAAMLRHPGEAYFPLIGALLARSTGQGAPLAWLARSLERAPINGNVHLVLAEVLAARGKRNQAFLHIRLAAVYDSNLQSYAYGKAVEWARSADDLINVFPRGMPGSDLLAELCEHARGEPTVGCWREASRRVPNAANEVRFAGVLLDALERGQAPCVGTATKSCVEEARRALDAAEKRPVSDFRTAYHRARLFKFEGALDRALEVVLEHCPTSSEAADCSGLALELALKARNPKTMERVAQRYTAQRCVEPSGCARAHQRIAEAYIELATPGFALQHLSEAAKLEPTAERWIQVAEGAARAGSSLTARVSLDRAQRTAALTDEQRGRMASVEALLRSGGRYEADISPGP